MPKRLIVLNVLLLAVAGASATYIVRDVSAPPSRPVPLRSRPAGPAAAAPAAPNTPETRPNPAVYGAIASRNLFSPTRTETPPVAQAPRPTAPPVKPNLQGVVVREGAPIAYLEDPTTKRVAGYRLGDSIAGATVESIHADHVVLTRPEGPIDVRLHDPSKPRPIALPPGLTPQQQQQFQQQQQQIQQQQFQQQQAQQPPFVPPPVSGGLPQALPPSGPAAPTVQPGIPAPQGSPVPRRPLPPSVLRRVPPVPSDGSQQ
jgi:type II secretion system (T2SS) protein C